MRRLVSSISALRKGETKKSVDSRMMELSRNFSSEEKIFSELCFCLLTANERAAKAMEIQENIGSGFRAFPQKKLVSFLKNRGYRFYNARAKYIVEARKHYGKLKDALAKLETLDRKLGAEDGKRDWLAQNVKGLGYKEASHLLRNLGFFNAAILDRHITRITKEHGMTGELPKTLDRKVYLETEAIANRESFSD